MGQSVLRQGVIARLKAAMAFGLRWFAERECVNIPQLECRELKWRHSDDPVNRVCGPRMTQSSLFEGPVDSRNESFGDRVNYPGKLHSLRAVGCLANAHGKDGGDLFLLHQAVPLTAIGLLG